MKAGDSGNIAHPGMTINVDGSDVTIPAVPYKQWKLTKIDDTNKTLRLKNSNLEYYFIFKILLILLICCGL